MSSRPNLRRHLGWILFGALAAAIVVSDQLLKFWIVGRYQVDAPVDVLGDWVRIDFIHNAGGLFGIFQNAAPLFALVSIGVIGVIVTIEMRWGWRSWLVTLALGLLLGGAVGNLIDRVRLQYVIDFMDIGIDNWRWYIFNIADSAISVSIGLLLLLSIFSPHFLAESGGPADDSAKASPDTERPEGK